MAIDAFKFYANRNQSFFQSLILPLTRNPAENGEEQGMIFVVVKWLHRCHCKRSEAISFFGKLKSKIAASLRSSQ